MLWEQQGKLKRKEIQLFHDFFIITSPPASNTAPLLQLQVYIKHECQSLWSIPLMNCTFLSIETILQVKLANFIYENKAHNGKEASV